ncbi:MAG: cytochrome c-type biogenesis protein CcmH [Hyphomicrobiaceae bacterium]|nr:cytochrome c-type biogenesis protein CcmH [Hyphomicrobiaceae bacterium]MCC0025290.1 cytochrome c-type biogenesis protein CcmH [Hyphomicrobiaceae bacterium]
MRRLLFAIALLLSLAVPALAVQPDEVLSDPALEARARAISAQLRCLVCQNQSIDDSEAGLARDLRLLVRERIVAGDTDDQVMEFLVDRYGEFVLLKPVFALHTLILWIAAPLVLIGGAIGLFVWVRRRPKSAQTATGAGLTEEEMAALARLTDKSTDA